MFLLFSRTKTIFHNLVPKCNFFIFYFLFIKIQKTVLKNYFFIIVFKDSNQTNPKILTLNKKSTNLHIFFIIVRNLSSCIIGFACIYWLIVIHNWLCLLETFAVIFIINLWEIEIYLVTTWLWKFIRNWIKVAIVDNIDLSSCIIGFAC